MSNDLHARIVAVIYDHPNPLSRDECEDLADAVIAHLGLRPEWGALDAEDNGTLADSRDELKVWPTETIKRRYITDWVADDE